jgi:uncharacterized protein YukE
MGFSDELSAIYRSLSSSSAAIDEKISRLQRAKSEIDQEQNISLQEIRKILEPELGSLWTGNRARSFDESRDEAHQIMQEIVNEDYDDYKQKIDFKIGLLKAERESLNFLGGLANEASQLLDKGEEAFDELGSRIDDLKRRIF